jgi:hypothetical protein
VGFNTFLSPNTGNYCKCKEKKYKPLALLQSYMSIKSSHSHPQPYRQNDRKQQLIGYYIPTMFVKTQDQQQLFGEYDAFSHSKVIPSG